MDLKIDGNSDVVIENGDLVLTSGVESVAQDVEIRLSFFLGEWFLDTRLGVPYFQRILGQKPRFSTVATILKKAIFTTPGIISISNFELDWVGATRTMNVSFNAESTEGPFTFNTELII
jgi:hypothetical protein